MKAASREFLYYSLWRSGNSVDGLMDCGDTFESTLLPRLSRRIAALVQRGLLTRPEGRKAATCCALTSKGRRAAWGGFDPVERWSAPWDGKWRLVFFDVPEVSSTLRVAIRRRLRAHRFGLLQGSVWVGVEFPTGELPWMKKAREWGRLVVFEGRPGNLGDSDIVTAAWDFSKINRRYERGLRLLQRAPTDRRATPKQRADWARAEWEAWTHAAEIDPFLPRELWPDGYLGHRYYQERAIVWRKLRESEVGP